MWVAKIIHVKIATEVLENLAPGATGMCTCWSGIYKLYKKFS